MSGLNDFHVLLPNDVLRTPGNILKPHKTTTRTSTCTSTRTKFQGALLRRTKNLTLTIQPYRKNQYTVIFWASLQIRVIEI
jgi:hypothetical protein